MRSRQEMVGAELPRWAQKVWYPDNCTKLELGVKCEEKHNHIKSIVVLILTAIAIHQ